MSILHRCPKCRAITNLDDLRCRACETQAEVLAGRSEKTAVDNEPNECNCTQDGLPYCGDPDCDIDFCRQCGDEYTDPCPRHQPTCWCDSHMHVGEDLWKCDDCGEVVRYVDDPDGNITLTELHPYRTRRIRAEVVRKGNRPSRRSR